MNDKEINQQFSLIKSRENLKQLIKELFVSYKKVFNSHNFDIFNKNLIDPFQMLIERIFLNKKFEEIIEAEIIRQKGKSCANLIGNFHQKVFHCLNPDWKIPKSGWDLINEEKKIYVEMKNKHNTMNSGSSKTVYEKMKSQVEANPDSQCFLVEIIVKKSQNEVWNPSFDGKKYENENIRRVSIDKFYELTTGDKEAFFKLISILPNLLGEVAKEEKFEFGLQNSSIINNLSKDGNIFVSLLKLAFGKFEGFTEFFEKKTK